jgi:hypothetical protein
VRSAFEYLRENLGEDIASARLVISGSKAVLVRTGDELIDVVNSYQGQGVLNLLALDDVRHELDASVRELRPVVVDLSSTTAVADVTHTAGLPKVSGSS